MPSLVEALTYALQISRKGHIRLTSEDEKFNQATNIVSSLVSNLKDYVMTAIWGPPGTGKTTIYLHVLSNYYDKLGKDYIASYIAPTNELLTETLGRHIAIMFLRESHGSTITFETLKTYLSEIRAYGSKVWPGRLEEIKQLIRNNLIDCGSKDINICTKNIYELLNNIVYSPPDSNTRILFSTEWQDLSKKVGAAYYEGLIRTSILMTFLIDEASRSPLYNAFKPAVSFLRELLSRRSSAEIEEFLTRIIDLRGLSVIGDSQQAIALHPYFHYREELLLLNAVYDALRSLGLCDDNWEGKACTMLEVTKRLPAPSHEPISVAYYKGRLKAVFQSRQRLALISDAAKYLRDISKDFSPRIAKLINMISDAIENRYPLVVVNTSSFVPGTTVEPIRSALAAIIASALSRAICKAGIKSISITITGLYNKQINYAKNTYELQGFKACTTVRFTTVHSILGGESDIHITLLGKEWPGDLRLGLYDIDRYDSEKGITLYYREPELLNVQLSRHRIMLIIIGNVDKLRSASYSFYKGHKDSSGKIIRKIAYRALKLYLTADYLLRLTRNKKSGIFIKFP